jgi:hypothetical protein
MSETTPKFDAGVKFDTGKSPVFRGVLRYFPRALKAVADISAFGAHKYDWGNWKTLDDAYNRYSDGLGRHILLRETEGVNDLESKMLHDAHAAWNALARLELYLMEQEKNKND